MKKPPNPQRRLSGAFNSVVLLGNMTHAAGVEAIVVPQSSQEACLTSSTALALAYAQEKAGLPAYTNPGPLPSGTAVLLPSGGGLPALLHASCLGAKDEFGAVRHSFLSALKAAEEKGIRSIATPTLGTWCSMGTLSAKKSAQAMLSALREYHEGGGKEIKVTFVADGDEEVFDAFSKELNAGKSATKENRFFDDKSVDTLLGALQEHNAPPASTTKGATKKIKQAGGHRSARVLLLALGLGLTQQTPEETHHSPAPVTDAGGIRHKAVKKSKHQTLEEVAEEAIRANEAMLNAVGEEETEGEETGETEEISPGDTPRVTRIPTLLARKGIPDALTAPPYPLFPLLAREENAPDKASPMVYQGPPLTITVQIPPKKPTLSRLKGTVLKAVQEVANVLGQPLKIVSFMRTPEDQWRIRCGDASVPRDEAYRCPLDINRPDVAHEHSYHEDGMAVDIRTWSMSQGKKIFMSDETRNRMIDQFISRGFRGLGIYDKVKNVQSSTKKAKSSWPSSKKKIKGSEEKTPPAYEVTHIHFDLRPDVVCFTEKTGLVIQTWLPVHDKRTGKILQLHGFKPGAKAKDIDTHLKYDEVFGPSSETKTESAAMIAPSLTPAFAPAANSNTMGLSTGTGLGAASATTGASPPARTAHAP